MTVAGKKKIVFFRIRSYDPVHMNPVRYQKSKKPYDVLISISDTERRY
jgi:hypothetical protein